MIAIDWRKHIRTWVGGDFFASMGVAVEIHDLDAFKTMYESLLPNLLKKYGYETNNKVLKSSQIATLFGEKHVTFHDFLGDFATELLSKSSVRLGIFYTILNIKFLGESSRDPTTQSSSTTSTVVQENEAGESTETNDNKFDQRLIRKYGRAGSSVELISPKQFLNELDVYYGVVCGWKYALLSTKTQEDFLIDGFDGAEVTEAWTELINNNKVSVAFHGDSCNAFISTADLVTRFIDIRLKAWRFPLTGDGIARVMKSVSEYEPGRILIKRVYNPDFKWIVASERRKIDLAPYLLRPTIFVAKEEESAQERTIVENSPMMVKIYDAAWGLNGSVVFFEPTKHSQYVRKGDFMAFYGNKGKYQFERLIKVGYEIQPMDFTRKPS